MTGQGARVPPRMRVTQQRQRTGTFQDVTCEEKSARCSASMPMLQASRYAAASFSSIASGTS